MGIAFFWIAFSVVVGVAANARGRDGVGWFFLALLISPLIALLLVLVMQRRDKEIVTSSNSPQVPFEPDEVHAGIPYRLSPDGSVEAVMQGARVRFADYKKFSASTGAPPLPSRYQPPQLPSRPQP
jgi:hypothetical protein